MVPERGIRTPDLRELVHILDGTKTLEIVCDDGPPKSFETRAGMIVVIPQGGDN